MNRLQERYGDQVKFVYLDAAGEGQEAFTTSGLRGHPALMLVMPDGDVRWRYQGSPTYQVMEEQILNSIEATSSP